MDDGDNRHAGHDGGNLGHRRCHYQNFSLCAKDRTGLDEVTKLEAKLKNDFGDGAWGSEGAKGCRTKLPKLKFTAADFVEGYVAQS